MQRLLHYVLTKTKKGKYGRILGEIICDGVNINQVMVETHLAVAYFGQSKEDIAEQHLQNRELIDHQTLFGHNLNDKKNDKMF